MPVATRSQLILALAIARPVAVSVIRPEIRLFVVCARQVTTATQIVALANASRVRIKSSQFRIDVCHLARIYNALLGRGQWIDRAMSEVTIGGSTNPFAAADHLH